MTPADSARRLEMQNFRFTKKPQDAQDDVTELFFAPTPK